MPLYPTYRTLSCGCCDEWVGDFPTPAVDTPPHRYWSGEPFERAVLPGTASAMA